MFIIPIKIIVAQNSYTLQIDSVHATGYPGDFLLAPIKLTNTTSQGFNIKIHRIEKTIPETWASCFCYPSCIAPWIDSLEWWVNSNETISIAPNFNTDPAVPGYGYIVVEIQKVGQSEYADTITCTGSTLGTTAIPKVESQHLQLFPNPANDNLHIIFNQPFSGIIQVLNEAGLILEVAPVTNSISLDQDISRLAHGCYILMCKSMNGKMISLTFIKE